MVLKKSTSTAGAGNTSGTANFNIFTSTVIAIIMSVIAGFAVLIL
jgi:hypothetical protein